MGEIRHHNICSYTSNPNYWGCSTFSVSGARRTLAAIYALESINKMLGTNYGMLFLDTCFSKYVSRTLLESQSYHFLCS